MENLWTKLSTLSTCLFYAEFFGSYARSHVHYKHCFITILRTNYSLGRNSVKFSRLFFTFSTIMNKTIPTTERVFMSLVGPSGCGKTQLIYEMLKHGTFQPPFEKIYYFFQFNQPIFSLMIQDIPNIEFIKCVDFELIDNLPSNNPTLLIFDDSCDEIMKSKSFEKLAIAGRHRKMSVIYIKHNLYHKSSIGRDAELQLTHIVLFKSARDVQQIARLGQQLGVNLIEWYKDATKYPYGHLMIDLNPKTNDLLRYSTDSSVAPTKFY